MTESSFARLKAIAGLVESSSAPVPLANAYVEYWHGAAFEVLGVRCVVSLREARKIVDLTPTISVPGTKQWVRGIANIGGRVLSISDLSAFLSRGEKLSKGKQVLLISGRGIHSGLVIDLSLGGVRFSSDQLQESSAVDARLQPFVSGVFETDEGEYAVFSIEKLLHDSDFVEAGLDQAN